MTDAHKSIQHPRSNIFELSCTKVINYNCFTWISRPAYNNPFTGPFWQQWQAIVCHQGRISIFQFHSIFPGQSWACPFVPKADLTHHLISALTAARMWPASRLANLEPHRPLVEVLLNQKPCHGCSPASALRIRHGSARYPPPSSSSASGLTLLAGTHRATGPTPRDLTAGWARAALLFAGSQGPLPLPLASPSPAPSSRGRCGGAVHFAPPFHARKFALADQRLKQRGGSGGGGGPGLALTLGGVGIPGKVCVCVRVCVPAQAAGPGAQVHLPLPKTPSVPRT